MPITQTVNAILVLWTIIMGSYQNAFFYAKNLVIWSFLKSNFVRYFLTFENYESFAKKGIPRPYRNWKPRPVNKLHVYMIITLNNVTIRTLWQPCF